MKNEDFALTITLDKSPDEVFDAINDVRGWWSGEVAGDATAIGAEFTYRYKGLHQSTQHVTELQRGRKIVWQVVESVLSFVANPGEWKGTSIVFELVQKGTQTELNFRHRGLGAHSECYAACSRGWTALLTENLPRRVSSGQQQPDVFAGV